MFSSQLQAYTREQLLLARVGGVKCRLSPTAVYNIRTLGLRRYARGVRAGCMKQRPIHKVVTVRSRDHSTPGPYIKHRRTTVVQPNAIINTNRAVSSSSPRRPHSSLPRVHVDRHANPHGGNL